MSRRVVWVALVLLLLAGGLLPGEAVASFVLSGQVVGETGAPVVGASVKLTNSRSGYERGLRWLDGEAEPEALAATVTDETGWYRLEVPRPGMWRVVVDAPGYVPMERRPEAYIGEERLAAVTLVPDAGLSVTVTAAGKPVPNARVWAASTLGPDGPWATFDLRQWRPSWPGRFTDERGRATVPRARNERLRAVAWKDGFRQVEETDAAGPVNLETEAVSERRVVRVVDARGKPVKNALIRVGDTPSWSAGATGEDGLFELALPGLEELTLRADAGDGRWVTEAFESLEEETLVLELPEPTVLSGRVSSAATGESLGGALVFRDRSGRVAETGDDGRYGLAFSEPVDNERVQAVAPGHRLSGVRVPMPPAGDLRPDTVYSVGAVREGKVPDVQVTGVPAPEPLELVLGAGGRLFGRVTTASGEPVSRGMVRTEAARTPDPFGPFWPGLGQRDRLSEDGTFSLEAVAPGSVTVNAYDDQGMSSEHGPFEVAPGVEMGPLELVHEGGVAMLEGRVLGSNGEPAGNVRVSWESSLPGVGGSSVTADATGRFRFHGVKPGPATVSAWHPERGQASREVVLHPGREHVELVLGPGMQVAGRVVGPEGQPVTQGRASVHPVTANPSPAQMRSLMRSMTRLGPDGSFAIPVEAPGDYGLRVEAPGFVPYTTPRDDLLNVGSEPVEGLVVRLERGGRIVGRISGLDEEELSRVQVRAQRSEPPQERRVGQVDHRGRYEIGSIDAGAWVVTATTDQPPRQVTREVAVPETGGETPLELAFPENELTLRGQVLLDGEPVSGAQVFVRSADEPQGVPVTGFTDSFGRFRVAGLLPDRYVVQVFQSSFGRGVSLRGYRELEVVADQEIVLDLERVEPERSK